MKRTITILIVMIVLTMCAFMGCKQVEDNTNAIKDGVRAELETTSDIELTIFETEQYNNGRIEHYIAKVDGKYYVVSATITDKLVKVDLIKEI